MMANPKTPTLVTLVKVYQKAKLRLQASFREDTMGNYLGDPSARTKDFNQAAIAIADFMARDVQ
jgi:hypothetical protein